MLSTPTQVPSACATSARSTALSSSISEPSAFPTRSGRAVDVTGLKRSAKRPRVVTGLDGASTVKTVCWSGAANSNVPGRVRTAYQV